MCSLSFRQVLLRTSKIITNLILRTSKQKPENNWKSSVHNWTLRCSSTYVCVCVHVCVCVCGHGFSNWFRIDYIYQPERHWAIAVWTSCDKFALLTEFAIYNYNFPIIITLALLEYDTPIVLFVSICAYSCICLFLRLFVVLNVCVGVCLSLN